MCSDLRPLDDVFHPADLTSDLRLADRGHDCARDVRLGPVVDTTEMEGLIACAVEACGKARHAAVALRDVAEHQLRRVRDAGRLLALVQRSDGGRPLKNSSIELTSYQWTLKQAGISRTTAGVWRRVAEIPEDIFDQFLRDAPRSGRDLTIAELLRTVASDARPLPKARTVTLVLSEAEHRAFEHQVSVLGAAYFTPTRSETLMTVLDRAYRVWLASQAATTPTGG